MANPDRWTEDTLTRGRREYVRITLDKRAEYEAAGWTFAGAESRHDWQAALMVRELDPVNDGEDPMSRYLDLAAKLGALIGEKQQQYGDSAGRAGAIMRVLYPDGIAAHQYDDALLVVRVLDKLSRIAQRGPDGRDRGGESPWKDLAGYGLLGWDKDRRAGQEG